AGDRAPAGGRAAPWARGVAPTRAAPEKLTMVSDCTTPATAGVEVTVAFVRTLAALACQISDVPACVLARFTRLHVSPAPDTVIVCAPAAIGPSDATNASSSSGAADVVI